jgi:transcription termination factor Rho
MKVALKAARVCIDGDDLTNVTKILERAAEYQDVLSKETDGTGNSEGEVARRLRMEYFAVRTTLVSVTL